MTSLFREISVLIDITSYLIATWLATRHVMNQQMIGKSWLEWENDLPNDSDSAEEEFLEYRQTVKKETPQLTIDHDIKSEVRPESPGRQWARN